MTTSPRSKPAAPRRTQRSDLTGLPLEPIDSFVLSQIDGATTVDELQVITGLTEALVRSALAKLASLGLVEIAPEVRVDTVPPPPRRSVPPPPSVPPSPPPSVPPSVPPVPGRSAEDAREEADARARARGGRRIRPDQMQRIDTYLIRGESMDFYALLGISPGSARAEIRGAYFRLAKEFHPDTYYGFELGPYRAKLERVFGRLTQAYDVLSKSTKRKAYDEYRRTQAVLGGRELVEREFEQTEEIRASSIPPDGAPVPMPPPSDPPEVPPEGSEAAPVEAAEAARAAAAAEPEPLSSGPETAKDERFPSTADGPAAGSPRAPLGPSASDRWRKQRTARQLAAMLGISNAPREKTRGVDYLASAERSAAAGEWGRVIGCVEAAERLGVDPAHDEALQTLAQRARTEMAALCFKQSVFAEGVGNLSEATREAEEACRYGPDVAAHWNRAALLLVKQNRDLHRAKDAAQRAVGLAPKEASYHLTLARVYVAAGLARNARREAEIAGDLPGGAEDAKALLVLLKGAAE